MPTMPPNDHVHLMLYENIQRIVSNQTTRETAVKALAYWFAFLDCLVKPGQPITSGQQARSAQYLALEDLTERQRAVLNEMMKAVKKAEMSPVIRLTSGWYQYKDCKSFLGERNYNCTAAALPGMSHVPAILVEWHQDLFESMADSRRINMLDELNSVRGVYGAKMRQRNERQCQEEANRIKAGCMRLGVECAGFRV